MSLSSSGGLHTTSRLSSPTRRVTRTSRGRPSSPFEATAGRLGRLGWLGWLGSVWVCVMPLLAGAAALVVLWRGRKGVTGGRGGRLRGLEDNPPGLVL